MVQAAFRHAFGLGVMALLLACSGGSEKKQAPTPETKPAAAADEVTPKVAPSKTDLLPLYVTGCKQGIGIHCSLAAKIHYSGEGVPQDFVLAHKWFNLAAAQGYESMGIKSSRMRNEVAKKMTPSQIKDFSYLSWL